MSSDHRQPSPGDDSAVADARAPSHAERCRTLAAQATSATLSTIARDPNGFPYGSLVTLAVDKSGRPLLLLSELAEHTCNLQARPEASLLLTEPLGMHDQPLALGRVTILGRCAKVSDAERADARNTFLKKQPSASYYVGFKDFGFYRLEPAALRYIGGFGRMSWVSAEQYHAAEPDSLAAVASGILRRVNEEHADAILACAVRLAGVADATSASMTAVDRYGFEMAAMTPKGPRAARLAFDATITTADEVRRSMVEMARRAQYSP
jgi:putative heme iron utilization protein